MFFPLDAVLFTCKKVISFSRLVESAVGQEDSLLFLPDRQV